MKFLWISRHPILADQIVDLQRVYGDDIVIAQHAAQVTSVTELRDEVEAADVIGAVLPMAMLADLLRIAGEKPVIRARMKRTLIPGKDGAGDSAIFTHDKWERVVRVVVEVVDL